LQRETPDSLPAEAGVFVQGVHRHPVDHFRSRHLGGESSPSRRSGIRRPRCTAVGRTGNRAAQGVTVSFRGRLSWRPLSFQSPSASTIVCPFLGQARFPPGSFFLFRTLSLQQRRRTMVDKDRIKGSAEQAKGKVKEVAGKLTGDRKLQSEGKGDQVKGKVRNAIGGVKDALRGKRQEAIIHGELLRLRFDVAQSTVSKYMVPRQGRPSQTWKTFLHNHADGIASIDLFVVPTIAFDPT